MQLRDLIPFRLRLALRYGPASSLGARLRLARCRLCNKLLLHRFPRPRSDARGLGVVVYEPRMQLFGEDKVVIAFLESGGATEMYTDTAIVLCRGCWKNKLRPALIAEIDKDVAAVAAGEGSKASDEIFLAILLESITCRGWHSFLSRRSIVTSSAGFCT